MRRQNGCKRIGEKASSVDGITIKIRIGQDSAEHAGGRGL